MSKNYNPDEMQVNQGSRLKNYIEKSAFTIQEICDNANVPYSSLYDMFKRSELLPSKVRPVLRLLNVSFAEFYGFENPDETAAPPPDETTVLKRENELLRRQLVDKEEIIYLLKKQTG